MTIHDSGGSMTTKHREERAALRAVVKRYQASVDAAARAARAEAEAIAVAAFGATAEPRREEFSPPTDPVEAECLHCESVFSTSAMRWEYRPLSQAAMWDMWCSGDETAALQPMWWCPTPYCDGAGFGHDIHAMGDDD